MLTVRELYDFLHEKGLGDYDVNLLFSKKENFEGNFFCNKDNILKYYGDTEVTGIDIYRNFNITEEF